ncbi:hypothetical protein [Janthinobacterium sp. PSPC2-1]|uniref:hypothetical protein n=1 Tax=unclassified Janthinobacterium TaxID=2610881 RepID=UPI003CF773FE
MSAIQANNGNKTVFNIIMENGLPYKPFIIAKTILFKQDKNKNAGIIHMELPDSIIDQQPDLLQTCRISIDSDEVYLDIGDYYIVGEHHSKFITKSAEARTLFVSIYKHGIYLAGFNTK